MSDSGQEVSRYKSACQVLLMCQIQGVAAVHEIYVLIFFSSIPIDTVVPFYGITIDKSVAEGTVNAIVRLFAVLGAFCSYQLFSRLSRRYPPPDTENIFWSST